MSELGPERDDLDRESAEADAAFESALRRAMRRVNPPETLAKFLAVAAEAQSERKARGRWAMWFTPRSGGKVLVLGRAPTLAVSALAATLLIGAGLAGGMHLHEEHRRDQATQEFDESIRITEQTMEHTREQLRRAGVPVDSDAGLEPR